MIHNILHCDDIAIYSLTNVIEAKSMCVGECVPVYESVDTLAQSQLKFIDFYVDTRLNSNSMQFDIINF